MKKSTASTWFQQQSGSEKSSSSPAPLGEVKGENESDHDLRRVPEMGILEGGSTSVLDKPDNLQSSSAVCQRKRDTALRDREHTRLRRLLRNRVSAQQARERKKAYLTELETKVKELKQKNSEMEERVSTLQNENRMLRQILKNTIIRKTEAEG